MALPSRPTKVWVTGARGMLGQAVVRALAQQNVATIASGRELDICDENKLVALAEAQRPTHLINCAAMTAVDRCESEQALASKINGEGPTTLGHVAARFEMRAAHVSTDYVFEGTASVPWREDAPCAPQSSYGKSKLIGEQGFIGALGAHGYVVRTSWLFGPDGANFVATMLKLMHERPVLRVVDDQRGRPTATPDLARALLELLGLGTGAAEAEAEAAASADRLPAGGIYHFANAGEVSWFDFATQILAEARANRAQVACEQVLPTSSAEFVRPAPRPAYSVLDTGKISAALGWAPRPFAEPLSEYVAQHLQVS